MTASVIQPMHYRLPARIRLGKPSENELACRLMLADRIADFPGFKTEDDGSATLPCRVNVFLQVAAPSMHKDTNSELLCTISREGILMCGLSRGDKHQVLSAGWGKLVGENVNIYLPRDEQELEVCWDVLQRAYQELASTSAKPSAARNTSPWEMPRFSRTTLQ